MPEANDKPKQPSEAFMKRITWDAGDVRVTKIAGVPVEELDRETPEER